MKRKHIYIPLFVFLGAGLVSLVASIIDFTAVNPQLSYSSETIQFDYDGASDGKDPNGNAFNAVDFLSDDIIKDGLAKSGLSYDVGLVRKYIAIENVVPENIVNEINAYTSLTKAVGTAEITTKDYHPVRYRIALYNQLDKKLSASKLNGLLDNIVTSYCDQFYTTYKKVFDTDLYKDVYKIDDYDYTYQAQVHTNKLEILLNYAKSVFNEHKDFTAEDQSFSDIYLKCEQLINNDVSRIENIIVLNALSKNIEQLKEYYTYKIERCNYDKIKYTSDLAAVTAQLAGYTKDSTVYINSGDKLISIASNSSVTYDKLLASQIALSNKIGELDTEIAEYQSILNDINSSTGSEVEYALLSNYIDRLGKDYAGVEEVFIKMLEAYNKQYVLENSITLSSVKYSSASIFSSAFIVRCIKLGAPIVLTTMLGIAIYYLTREIKKQKKKAAQDAFESLLHHQQSVCCSYS